MSEQTMIVRFKEHGHVPQTGTSYDPGTVVEVPSSWAINELDKKSIEPATPEDLASYQKTAAEAEKAEKKTKPKD